MLELPKLRENELASKKRP